MENEKLIEQLQSDLKKALMDNIDDICAFCTHYVPCKGKKCECYEQGSGGVIEDTNKRVDWNWTCMDFNYGTCGKLENTPCNKCMNERPYFSQWTYNPERIIK